MQLPTYEFETSRSHFAYEFVSVGPKGLITKRVQFTLIHPSGMYNLAFGDVDPAQGGLDDQVISNNGDREKVLATVVATAHDFCRNHLGASIFVVGVRPPARGFTRWVSPSISTASKRNLTFMANLERNGSLSNAAERTRLSSLIP